MTLIRFIEIAALAAAPQLLLPAEAIAQPGPEQATPSDFEKQANALLESRANGPGAAAIATTGCRDRVDAARSRVVFHPENGKVDRLTIHRGARELHGKRTDG